MAGEYFAGPYFTPAYFAEGYWRPSIDDVPGSITATLAGFASVTATLDAEPGSIAATLEGSASIVAAINAAGEEESAPIGVGGYFRFRPRKAVREKIAKEPRLIWARIAARSKLSATATATASAAAYIAEGSSLEAEIEGLKLFTISDNDFWAMAA